MPKGTPTTPRTGSSTSTLLLILLDGEGRPFEACVDFSLCLPALDFAAQLEADTTNDLGSVAENSSGVCRRVGKVGGYFAQTLTFNFPLSGSSPLLSQHAYLSRLASHVTGDKMRAQAPDVEGFVARAQKH